MAEIRALSSTARCMQRLGYLKHLVRRVVALGTSSLNNLGRDLTQRVLRKVREPLTVDRVLYIRQRLYDRAYNSLKKQAGAWQECPGPLDRRSASEAPGWSTCISSRAKLAAPLGLGSSERSTVAAPYAASGTSRGHR